ncbi:hypothetical protein MD273_18755, partial [Marinobacter pelagius]|nr:hypothetical protein [Marinobacter sp. C7]
HAQPTTGMKPSLPELAEKLGELTVLHMEVDPSMEHALIAKVPGHHDARRGDAVHLGFKAENLHFFGEDGTRLQQTLVA